MDLVSPFRTSFGNQTDRDILLLRWFGADGEEGWGECVALSEPVYSPEFVDGVELVLEQHIWPRLLAAGEFATADIAEILEPLRGHPMAKAAVEMAALDAELRDTGTNLRRHLGASRDRIPSGVSVGIHPSIDDLLTAVDGYVRDGYARIKLKIEPGWDIEPVREVRALIGPDMALQVDANTAYGRDDVDHLCHLDEFDLLLIEQPMAEEDLIGHARLAAASTTPVCLDESIVSARTAADAIELGAAEVINIKPGRVGGYLESRRIHDLCVDAGVPVRCGDMLETGIVRDASDMLAALDGFTLPGDISASSRFWARDIVMDPITVVDGHVAVPDAPGLGFELDMDELDRVTYRTRLLD